MIISLSELQYAEHVQNLVLCFNISNDNRSVGRWLSDKQSVGRWSVDLIKPKSIWKKFRIKNMGEHHTCMFKVIHYYWLTILRAFKLSVLKYIILIMLIFSSTRISMVSSLKKKKEQLELLTNIEILLMVEKSIRTRIC